MQDWQIAVQNSENIRVDQDQRFIRTKHERIDELEEAGLVWVDKDPRKGHTRLVYPTEKGGS